MVGGSREARNVRLIFTFRREEPCQQAGDHDDGEADDDAPAAGEGKLATAATLRRIEEFRESNGSQWVKEGRHTRLPWRRWRG